MDTLCCIIQIMFCFAFFLFKCLYLIVIVRFLSFLIVLYVCCCYSFDGLISVVFGCWVLNCVGFVCFDSGLRLLFVV